MGNVSPVTVPRTLWVRVPYYTYDMIHPTAVKVGHPNLAVGVGGVPESEQLIWGVGILPAWLHHPAVFV